jgi:hypothetical protein
MKASWNKCLPYLVMAFFALTRWPGLMPQNFSAAYGLVFCAGAFFPGRMAWWLPLGTLLTTDIALNLHYGAGIVRWEMGGNYAAYLALIWLGRRFTSKAAWPCLLGGGMVGAILFYLITNTFSWLHDPAYPKTLTGWIQALSVGRPGLPPTWEFFLNTLSSGGLFTGLFAGAMKLSGAGEPAEAKEPEAEEAEEGKTPAPGPNESEPQEAKS